MGPFSYPMRIPLRLIPPITLLGLGLLLLSAALPPSDDERVPFPTEMPCGIPEMPGWGSDENRRRYSLGQRLFFDTRLSIDRTISCASCHPVDRGFASPEPLPRRRHRLPGVA